MPASAASATVFCHGAGAAEELARGHGAAQIEVRVVLPREADAAEHLDAVLGDRRRSCRARSRQRPRSTGASPRRRRRRARSPRPTRRRGFARWRRACWRSGASRLGTDRSVARTACAPRRSPPRCRRTSRAPPARSAANSAPAYALREAAGVADGRAVRRSRIVDAGQRARRVERLDRRSALKSRLTPPSRRRRGHDEHVGLRAASSA